MGAGPTPSVSGTNQNGQKLFVFRNRQGGTQMQTHCGEETNFLERGVAFSRNKEFG